MITLSGISPQPGEKLVSTDSLIEFTLIDDGVGIDISTLVVQINGFDAVSGIVFSSGFNGINSSIDPDGNNYGVIIHSENEFSIGSIVTVKIQVQNTNNQYFNTSYSFKIIPEEPVLMRSSPENNSILFSTQILYLEFEDSNDGIDTDSLNVSINGLKYIDDGVIVTQHNGGFSTISLVGNVLKVKIEPIEWLRNNAYILSYSVSDNSSNILIGSLNFAVNLQSAILPITFSQTGFLGFYQGIKRVSDLGMGDTFMIEWNQPIKKIYNNDLFVLIYENESRLSTFDSPKYITSSSSYKSIVSGYRTGKTLSFGARALEIDSGVFNFSGMVSASDELYLIPDSTVTTEIFDESDFILNAENVSGYPEAGLLIIGTEVIRYNSVDRNNNKFTIPSNGRAVLNSIQSSHLSGETIKLFVGCTDTNSVIAMATPTYQDGYGFDRNFVGEGFLVTDFTDNDATYFQGYDFCGWHDTQPIKSLSGKDDCGSYLGGEFNGFRGFDIYERMLNQEEVLLQTTGEPVILMKRLWNATTCSCMSSRKMSPKMKSCKLCFGTGFTGGYDQYDYLRREDRRILVHFDESTEDLSHGERESYQQAYEPGAWTLAMPAIRDRDLIVRFDLTNDREFIYEVLNVSREKIFNKRVGRQKLSLKRLDKTDIVYTFPLDLSNI